MDSPSLVLVETVRPNASMSPLAESIEKPRARSGAESGVRKCVRVYVCVCERALVCEGACVCVWVYCVRACVYTVGGVVCLWVGGLVGVACDTFAGVCMRERVCVWSLGYLLRLRACVSSGAYPCTRMPVVPIQPARPARGWSAFHQPRPRRTTPHRFPWPLPRRTSHRP